jgi:hypothetical protein
MDLGLEKEKEIKCPHKNFSHMR